MSFLVGQVTHYYEKLGFAIVQLDSIVGIGDRVRFVFNGQDLFDQTIKIMQIEHEKVQEAKKGETVAIKVDRKVPKHAEIFTTTQTI